MAKLARQKCIRLPEKLRQIRLALKLSQSEMLKALGLESQSFRSTISGLELGTREPALPILLRYAQLAGVCCDLLLDDSVDLPSDMPSNPKHNLRQ